MAEPKTRPTDADVGAFLAAVEHPGRRADAEALVPLLSAITGAPPVLWGPSIVGFGTYRGPTGDWPLIGFSPRKAKLVLYLAPDFDERRRDLVARLGQHTTGRSCLYVNRLADVDAAVLRELAEWSVATVRAQYGG